MNIIGASVKTVKLKIDKATNKGKIEYLELTRQAINKELEFYNNIILVEGLNLNDKLARNKLEDLTHATRTKQNPKYPLKQYMIPSPVITKRSIIASSIGHMKSYLTRLEKWEQSNKKKGKPNLPSPSTMPTFYYADFKMEWKDIENQFVALRVFTGEKWEFVNYPVKFTKQFIEKYSEHLDSLIFNEQYKDAVKCLIDKGIDEDTAKKQVSKQMGINPYYEMCSPSLTCKKGEWYLAFPFEKKIYLKSIKTQLKEGMLKRTLAVDLGINHLAVVTIKDGDKFLKTEFISGAKTNQLRYNALKTITHKQKLSGKPVKDEKSNKKLWEYIKNLNEDTAHQVSAKIVKLAKEYDCQVIIFEHLKSFSKNGKDKTARMNLKLNYWLHGKIVKYASYKAYGEKIITVERNPFMSSQIHYSKDIVGERFSPNGSGKSLIMFEDRTMLNADFNGSANMHRKFYQTFPKVNMKEVREKRKQIKEKLESA